MTRLPSGLFGLTLPLLLAACDSSDPDTRPVGLMDDAAMHSCEHITETATPLTAAASADAASAAVVALGETPYLIDLPASGEGYAVLRTTEEHTTVALFVRERDALVSVADAEVGTARKHAICPDTIGDDLRPHIHVPGDHLLTFSADAPRQVLVLALLQMVGDPGTDGGMHVHDEDGGHVHDEDAGLDAGDHVHDEDAGAHDHDGG